MANPILELEKLRWAQPLFPVAAESARQLQVKSANLDPAPYLR